MHSNYQAEPTHYANLDLEIHDRINDLNRRAERLAPRAAYEALDSGCTNARPTGPRQAQAWDMIAEAHSWNAISDMPSEVDRAELAEAAHFPYKIIDGAVFIGPYDSQPEPVADDHVCAAGCALTEGTEWMAAPRSVYLTGPQAGQPVAGPEPELSPEQIERAEQYTSGYRAGLSDAHGGCSRNWAAYSDQRKAGYRSGYAWGLSHPLPSVVLNGGI